jgi:alpha-1,6-mannosyltransferase
MKTISPKLLLPAIVIEGLLLGLRWQGSLRHHLEATILLYALSSIVYLVSIAFVLKTSENRNSLSDKYLTLFVLAVALLIRLTVWPLAPALSDDPYRYRWEGKLQAEGGNPYQARPNDAQWARLRDATFPLVPGKDVKAGYGPLIELLEWWTYESASALTPDPQRQVTLFKTPFALFDLATIMALLALLHLRGLPTSRILIYAWSPLPVMEFWATGHNDAVPVFFVVLALVMACRERWTASFAALAIGASAKIWPLVLFPVFIGWENGSLKRRYQWWIAVPVLALLSLPYWSNVSENLRFMTGFLGGWRNNDSLFGLLLWLTGDVYRAKYVALAIIVAVAAFASVSRWPLERACLVVLAAMLFVSSNCHPWYLSWILPLLALLPIPGLLLWTALMPLAYQVVIDWVRLGVWRGSTGIRWWIYVPVFASLLGQWVVQRRTLVQGRKGR